MAFPIYREGKENNISDRKGLKMKIGKETPVEEMTIWRKTEGEYWDDKVNDQEVLRRIGEKREKIGNRLTQ